MVTAEGETILRRLSEFMERAAPESLPEEVASSARQRVLDALGICLAADALELGDGAWEIVSEWGGRAESSVVAREGRYPAPQAALVNGTLAHSLDFDDTHLPSVLHPSASVVPAALAQAEASAASGAEAMAAAAAGLEICVRLGMGGYLPDAGNIFFEKGWHATSICGAIASAAAGARLLGLGAEGIGHAMGIASSMAGGLIESNRAGGTVKRLHCGWAAHAGLSAARLAQHGYTGPPTVFEGRFGFYNAFCDGRYDDEAILGGLGERWEVPGIFFKPYPANHYTHAGIDAALAIRARHDVDPDRIARIRLGGATSALRTIGEPREEKLRPQSGYHAQFSGPFTVAAALLGGGGLGLSFEDFTDERARDPRVLALARKVETYADPECDRIFPMQFPAALSVEMEDGTVFEERVLVNRGGPGNPLTDDELRLKFRINAERALPPGRVEQLAAACDAHADAPGVAGLFELTRAEGSG